MLTPWLKLSGDVAYLPDVMFKGRDNHPLRKNEGPSTFSPAVGNGTGVQVEGLLSYDITSEFSLGVGARYWSMSVPHGTTDFFSKGLLLDQRFGVEQAAVYAQGSFKFDGPSD
jgi:hypothetical protein